jgi:hypothetical protein
MQAEQALQADADSTGAGTIVMLPTARAHTNARLAAALMHKLMTHVCPRQVVINDVQYRGRLEPSSVLRAICAGFEEGTEPQVCLTAGLEARSSSARAAVLLADARATACCRRWTSASRRAMVGAG